MTSRPGYVPGRARLAALFTAVALLVAGTAPFAHAVMISAGPATTLSNYAAGVTGVTYSFGTYQAEAGETLQTIVIDLPADTGAAGATLVEPAGTLTVAGQTLTIALSPAPTPGSDITITVAGITNPTTPDTYPTNASYKVEFNYTNAKGQSRTDRLSIGSYTITPAPYLSITIPTANVDFGAVDPEVTPPPATLDIVIDANMPYTVTRGVTGDATALNLTVTGDAAGSKPAGIATYTDTVTISPSWDAPAGTPLTASIVYTAVIP